MEESGQKGVHSRHCLHLDASQALAAPLTMTGEWRSKIPTWDASKCKQCLLCTPFCPDSSIPVSGGKRSDFDYDHCKGCGICYKVCPFGAIDWKEVH